MDYENIVFLDFSGNGSMLTDEHLDSLVERISSLGGRAKVIIDFQGFPLSNSLINSLTSFYIDYGSLISLTVFCGVASGVRRVILESTGISKYFAEERDQAVDLINDKDGEDGI